MNSKTFHLGDILSITTHHLVSPTHIEGVYNILNFITNDDLFTHQLPRAADECRPYLLEQFPQLAELDGDDITRDNWQDWLKDKVKRFGEYHEVYPIHSEDHVIKDPIQELLDRGIDESRIISIDVNEDKPSDVGNINWKVE